MPKSFTTQSIYDKQVISNTKGGTNKLHIGPRGGKYVVVSGKKKYIKK